MQGRRVEEQLRKMRARTSRWGRRGRGEEEQMAGALVEEIGGDVSLELRVGFIGESANKGTRKRE